MTAKTLDRTFVSVAFEAAASAVHLAGHAMRVWRHRREVARLLGAEDHILSDLGITRQDVEGAMAAPLMHDPSHQLLRARGERRAYRSVRRSI